MDLVCAPTASVPTVAITSGVQTLSPIVFLMCAFLYTATGVLPLAHRCLILALKYLQYILPLPASHITHWAFRECGLLHAAGKPSWLGDLAIAIGHLPCCPPVWNPLLATEDSITKLIADIKVSMNAHIDSVIASSSKGHLL
jgi:hypothetical protein